MKSSLPYHEPGIVTILIYSSFILSLNVINYVFDNLLYCGLIGEIFLGVAFGAPTLSPILSDSAQETIVDLGYIGLLLMVYEGGLSTNFKALKENMFLSLGVAATGILIPMGMSFVLLTLVANSTALQSFAAGASLCSTSLGTTFTVLGTTGLMDTRMGVILSSAAMIDDVIGLVMVQVISNLGSSSGEIEPAVVVRPVAVSLGLIIVIPLVAWLIVKPATEFCNSVRSRGAAGRVQRFLSSRYTCFAFHSCILIGLITGATYAGTSNLFAAYLAGASISWWDSELPHPKTQSNYGPKEGHTDTTDSTVDDVVPRIGVSGAATFYRYFQPVLARLLQPFFFASIGFSIPITELFDGSIVWRGLTYAVLMVISKLFCGLWLVRLSIPQSHVFRSIVHVMSYLLTPLRWVRYVFRRQTKGSNGQIPKRPEPQQHSPTQPPATEASISTNPQSEPPSQDTSNKLSSKQPKKPLTVYPSLIVAWAMVARGEIGFLISALAQSQGIFDITGSDGDTSDIFLVVTWAVMLCTIIGPIVVGMLVRRVRKLEKTRAENSSGKDVMGVWGVN